LLRKHFKRKKNKKKIEIEEKKKTDLSLRWGGGTSVTRGGGEALYRGVGWGHRGEARCCIEVAVRRRSRSSRWGVGTKAGVRSWGVGRGRRGEALYRGGGEAMRSSRLLVEERIEER
jgi:hypothetical protein